MDISFFHKQLQLKKKKKLITITLRGITVHNNIINTSVAMGVWELLGNYWGVSPVSLGASTVWDVCKGVGIFRVSSAKMSLKHLLVSGHTWNVSGK